jgi:hypothetical protein
VASLLADLISADGPAVALGKSTIDLRTIEAGTYYLRVYNPTGASVTNLPFVLEVSAPEQGYVHPISDRDRIHGGEGDDLLVGNMGLDRIWGDSGRDDFIAESIEIHDFDSAAGEQRTLPPGSERSTIPAEGAPVDAAIAIEDRAAWLWPKPWACRSHVLSRTPLIHVDNQPERIPAGNSLNRERILASDLGEITMLDASSRHHESEESAVRAESRNAESGRQ